MKTKIFADFQICISLPLRRWEEGRSTYEKRVHFVTKLHFLRTLLQIKQPPIKGIFPFLYKKW